MTVLAVAVQGFALARVSPWLHPVWAVVLAVTVGAATLPVVRTRRVWGAMVAQLGLSIAAFGLAAVTIEVMTRVGWTARTNEGGWAPVHLLMAVGGWWALQAPVTIARWRAWAIETLGAARRLDEVTGLSLVATALALTVKQPSAVWTTGACAALGVVALGRAWWPRADGRAVTTEDVAPYRVARLLAPGASDRHGAWRRWAALATVTVWVGMLVGEGGWRLLHIRPRGRWSVLVDALQAIRMSDDPCRVESGPNPRRDLSSVDGSFGSVWASGGVVTGSDGRHGFGSERLMAHCASSTVARRWVTHAESDGEADRAALLELTREPERWRSSPCAPGRWCSVGAEGIRRQTAGNQGAESYWLSCTLVVDGTFRIGERNRGGLELSGRIPAAQARALIDAIQITAEGGGELTMQSFAQNDPGMDSGSGLHDDMSRPPAFLVGVDAEVATHQVEFPMSREIGAQLWRRVCDAIYHRSAYSPEAVVTLPDDP